MEHQLTKPYLMYGTDPEGFFMKGGNVIGSEKVIPEGGLYVPYSGHPFVVMDGVQFELNPKQGATPKHLGNNLSAAFTSLKQQLSHMDGVECCWKGTVEVSRTELNSLSEKSRVLGCQPSKNIYGVRPIRANADTYRKRSAGGHLHLGLTRVANPIFCPASHPNDERMRLIPLLDIFVGNLSVLLDRDPQAAERRVNYGRAGEFRLPKHGVEYRTPSNFWLRNYSLLSLVTGLADIAIASLAQTLSGVYDYEQELVDMVNIERVIKAIDTNNSDLALKNFDDLRPFFERHVHRDFPVVAGTLKKFVEFAHVVQVKGLESVFPDDPLTHWPTGVQVEFDELLRSL